MMWHTFDRKLLFHLDSLSVVAGMASDEGWTNVFKVLCLLRIQACACWAERHREEREVFLCVIEANQVLPCKTVNLPGYA